MEGKSMKKLFFVILVFILITGQAYAQAPASEQEKRIQDLEKMVQEQEKRIQQLQNRMEAEEEQSTQTDEVIAEYINRPDTQEAKINVGYEDGVGFFIRGLDGDIELDISGFFQYGLAIFETNSVENNSAYPNGVYLAFDGYAYDWVHGRLEVDFLSANYWQKFRGGAWNFSVVRDGYIELLGKGFGVPEFNIRVGQTHVPFTMEGQYCENQGMTITGEPFIFAWAHGRDPGLLFWGLISDMLEWKMGLFHGDGAANGNRNDDFMMAGSLRVYPMKYSENPNTFLHIGFIRSRDPLANNAALVTPWGRPIFGFADTNDDGVQDTNLDWTEGWRTGVDVAMRYEAYMGEDKINLFRTEAEFMYIMWERDLDGLGVGRQPFMEGWGFWLGFLFQHNLTPEVEGAGIFGAFKFSYTDVDNRNTDDPGLLANPLGQRIWVYTLGVGYAFNKHLVANFNWLIVNMDERTYYGSSKRDASGGGYEHAWALQFTFQF
jgi:uncharacterized coiled-coil protein SlyX